MKTLDKMTKAELVAMVQAQGKEIVAMREELSTLRVATSSPRAWPTVTEHVKNIPAHFAAAREAAMRLGRVVKVGGAS